MLKNKEFIWGASLVPLARGTEMPMEQWERDFATFAKLGFNTFRAFAAWDRIEPETGKKDYSKLDYAFQLAKKHKLKVIVNVGGSFDNLCGIYPPQWLIRDLNCQHIVENPLMPGLPPGHRISVCMDDPVYQQKAEAFIRETVARYMDTPELLAWSVWNEPVLHGGCYCPHTIASFQAWLREKYASIQNLCCEWGTEFPVLYHDWDEITPPHENRPRGYLPSLDFYRFSEDNLTAKISWTNNIVKELDKTHPTTVNQSGAGINSPSPVMVDFAAIGQVVDIQGTSMYNMGDFYTFRDSGVGRVNNCLSKIRCSSQAPNREFWLLETEAGPCHWITGKPEFSSPAHRRLVDAIALGNGAKSVLYWLFRSRITDIQAGEFGLLAWDGELTERAEKCAQSARAVIKNGKVLYNSFPMKAKAAVLQSRDVKRIGYIENYERGSWDEEDKLKNAMYINVSANNAFNFCKDAGFNVDYLFEQPDLAEQLKEYQVLFVPFFPYMDETLAKILETFVANGGIIVADGPLAIKDKRAIHWQQTPGAGLDTVFGYTCNDMLPTDNTESFDFNDSKVVFNELNFHMKLKPSQNAEVIGCFNNGDPAVVVNQYGQGMTIFMGTMAFRHYNYSNGGKFRRQLAELLTANGLVPDIETELPGHEDDDTGGKLGFYSLSADGENISVIIAVNKNEFAVQAKLSLREKIPAADGMCDIFTSRTYMPVRDGDKTRLTLDIPALTPLILVGCAESQS